MAALWILPSGVSVWRYNLATREVRVFAQVNYSRILSSLTQQAFIPLLYDFVSVMAWQEPRSTGYNSFVPVGCPVPFHVRKLHLLLML